MSEVSNERPQPARVWRMSLMCLLVTATLSVADQSGDFTYTVNGGAATITGYTGTGGDVDIPGTINSLPVTGIGYAAFKSYTNLTAITIPDSVTTIGDHAFEYCTSITNVTMGSGVANIGWRTFYACTSLTRITIPDSITSIESSAFYSCTSLANLTMGTNVTSIGNNAFYKCTSLTNATIGNGVASIETYAFYDCTSLTEVYFKGNAPSLGDHSVLSSTSATVYYLGGTEGWGATFDDRPTALWLLPIQHYTVNIGVQDDEFGFNIAGTAHQLVVVETCTNLTDGGWIPVQTNTIPVGLLRYSDPDWINHPGRYYRIAMPLTDLTIDDISDGRGGGKRNGGTIMINALTTHHNRKLSAVFLAICFDRSGSQSGTGITSSRISSQLEPIVLKANSVSGFIINDVY